MGPSLGEHSIGCLAGMVPARIEGSEGRFRPTPEAPPACWRVKDRLEEGVLAFRRAHYVKRTVCEDRSCLHAYRKGLDRSDNIRGGAMGFEG